MFAGSCCNWRLQWVLQCRVQVTRVQGVFGLESNAAKVGIPLTEKIYIFICIGLIKIYILFMKLNQPYDEMYMLWDDLLVSIMFKLYQWCLRDSARVKSID
jgi:hypothetical protein